jgi:mRNA interferase RelE/StbE
MTYKLKFLPVALKEWKKLGETIKEQLKKKLQERLENPRVAADQLNGLKDHYKIKLRASGYRLVYKVCDKEICVISSSSCKKG